VEQDEAATHPDYPSEIFYRMADTLPFADRRARCSIVLVLSKVSTSTTSNPPGNQVYVPAIAKLACHWEVHRRSNHSCHFQLQRTRTSTAAKLTRLPSQWNQLVCCHIISLDLMKKNTKLKYISSDVCPWCHSPPRLLTANTYKTHPLAIPNKKPAYKA